MSFLLKFAVFIAISGVLLRYWLQHKTFTFDPDYIAEVTKKNVVFHPDKAYTNIAQALRKRYGSDQILPDSDLEWILMSAGGWTGSVCLLHVSLTECVAFFGTAVDTTGHSGRYWMNITDTILTGTYVQWRGEGPDTFTAHTFTQGDTVRHGAGEAAAVSWRAGTWMVQYGRGVTPTTLLYTISDTLTSTHDYYSLFKIGRVSAKSLYQRLVTTILHLKHKYLT